MLVPGGVRRADGTTAAGGAGSAGGAAGGGLAAASLSSLGSDDCARAEPDRPEISNATTASAAETVLSFFMPNLSPSPSPAENHGEDSRPGEHGYRARRVAHLARAAGPRGTGHARIFRT